MATSLSHTRPAVLSFVLWLAVSGAGAQVADQPRSADERAAAQRTARELRELEAEVRKREAAARTAEQAASRAESQARTKVEAEVRAAETQRATAEKREQEQAKKLAAEEAQRAKAEEARRLAEEKRAKEEAALRIAPYAALAVGTQVINYGWARDAESLAAAEKEAIQNCQRSGDNCSVVLAWSGNGCGAYRSSKDGEVYGWGGARMLSAASAAAFDDASKRSKGRASSEIIQTCNTKKTSAVLEVLVQKPANIGGPKECLLQFEAQFDNQRGDWEGRFYSPVYHLQGADCPRHVGDSEYDGYTANPYMKHVGAEAMKKDPSGKGLRQAEEFRAWLVTKRSPVAGTVIRDVGATQATKVTPKLLKDLVENISILDAGMTKSPLRRVFPLCFDFKPAGVTPIATHGAEHCKTWIR